MEPGRVLRPQTIYAPATGPGRAAIAIIRISGPSTEAALTALLGKPPPPQRSARLMAIRRPSSGERIDRALVLFFAAPRSFTGEPMAELHITGGRATLAATLAALAEAPGLRPAEPGEFALRAFENGKLDLAEVEGLADLVDAQTEAQRRQAQRIAGGALSRASEAIRGHILEAMAMVEAEIDFSDQDDVDPGALAAARRHARAAALAIDEALKGASAGERLRDGFRVVIAGPPNVGKSTLMNALARRDVAIVSATPGTTRDVLEVALDLRGFPVLLVDTAGIRAAEDAVEREGIARALLRIEDADLTLWLQAPNGEKAEPPAQARQLLHVRTKSDLAPAEAGPEAIRISALAGLGLEELLDAIADIAEESMGGAEPALLTQERHRLVFLDAERALRRALNPANSAAELIGEDLRLAARALERIAGRIDVEDVLGQIFARLCIGK